MLSRIISLWLLLVIGASAADTKIPISGLPSATSANSVDLVPAVQAGVTKKMTLGMVLDTITKPQITNALGFTGSALTFLRSDGTQAIPAGSTNTSANWVASGLFDSTLSGEGFSFAMQVTNGIYPLNVGPSVMVATDGSGRLAAATLGNATNLLGLTGSATTFLRSDGTQAVPPGSGGLTNLTAQGDILSFDGSFLIRVPVGGDGTFLQAFGGDVGYTANGSTLLNLNASQLSSGVIPDGRYTGGSPIFNAVTANSVTVTNGTAQITFWDTNLTHNVRMQSPDVVVTNVNIILPDRPATGISHYTQSATTNVTQSISAVVEGDLSLSANTTANVSTTKHGFAPVLPNNATQYLDGTGNYTTPGGSFSGVSSIGITVDGAGSAITTGVKGYISVPYTCTINSVTMLADQNGSAVMDIWKDTYANYPPTVADTITASAKPTITSTNKYTSSTLTGWTNSITAGDVLGFNVDSAATITRLTLILKVTK